MDPINAALAALELQDPPNYTWIAKEFNVNYTTLSWCYWRIRQEKIYQHLILLFCHFSIF